MGQRKIKKRSSSSTGTGSWSLAVAELPPWVGVTEDPTALGLLICIFDETSELMRHAVPTDSNQLGHALLDALEGARRGEGLPPGAPGAGRWPQHLYVWPPPLQPVIGEMAPSVAVEAREPHPAIGEFIEGMLAELAPSSAQLYRESTSDAFLAGAARLAEAAPWTAYPDHVVLEITRTDGAALKFPVATLLGGAEQVYGLALYEDVDAWHQLAEASVAGVMPQRVESLALYFHDEHETPPIDQQHFAERGYVPTDLFPVLMLIDDGDVRLLEDDDASIALEREMVTVLEAVNAWCAAHPQPADDGATLELADQGVQVKQHILTPPTPDFVDALQPLIPQSDDEPREAILLADRDALRELAGATGRPAPEVFDTLTEQIATLVLRVDPEVGTIDPTRLVEGEPTWVVLVEAPPPPPELDVEPFSYSVLLTTAEYQPVGVLAVLAEPAGVALDEALLEESQRLAIVVAQAAPADGEEDRLPAAEEVVWVGVLGILEPPDED